MDKKMIDDAIGFEIPEELYENAVISARKKTPITNTAFWRLQRC